MVLKVIICTSIKKQVPKKVNPRCAFQHKNASSVLEYERMADFGFEKRDFRKVCYN